MAVTIKGKEVSPRDLMNAIITNSGVDAKYGIPLINSNGENLGLIGTMLNNTQAAMNEIQACLVNRVIFTIIKTARGMQIQDIFDKGMIEVGYTIQEIYNDLIFDNITDYNKQGTATEVFRNAPANTQAAYHNINLRKKIELSVNNDALARAFVSFDGLERYIASTVETLTETYRQYMYEAFKGLLGAGIDQGFLKPVTIRAVTDNQTAKDYVVEARAAVLGMGITSTKYNMAQVYNRDNPDDIYIVVTPKIAAMIDVEVLAAAFNLTYAEFIGHMIVVDDFGTNNNSVQGVIISKDFINIFTNLFQMATFYDPSSLTWKYFLHFWKTMFISPFAQGVVLTTTGGTINSVSITPATVSMSKGQGYMLQANVTGTGVISGQVKWSLSGATDETTYIKNGLLYIGENEHTTQYVTGDNPIDSRITVTASAGGKSGTCKVSVS